MHHSRILVLSFHTLLMSILSQAVAALHAQRISHGDLKPANLLLSALGHLKLVDFGSAQSFAVESPPAATAAAAAATAAAAAETTAAAAAAAAAEPAALSAAESAAAERDGASPLGSGKFWALQQEFAAAVPGTPKRSGLSESAIRWPSGDESPAEASASTRSDALKRTQVCQRL